jgi:hypothetical protein
MNGSAPRAGGRPGAAFAASAVVALLAALLAGRLAGGVLSALGADGDAGTLARALPGPAGALLLAVGRAPLLAMALAGLVPLACWTAAVLAARPARTEPRQAHLGLSFAWLVSVVTSVSAWVAPPADAKQGLAALGYALGWPAYLSLVALLGPSRLPRPATRGALLAALLALLVVRALPLGWPGETSLSWWAMLPAVAPARLAAALLLVAVATFAVVAVLARGARGHALASLAPLVLASLLLQRALPELEHYGPAKHPAALASEINTSYLQAAWRVRDPASFVRGHADSLGTLPMHARTHPPLWPLVFHGAVGLGETPYGRAVAGAAARLLGADVREAAELAASVAERPLADAEVTGLWLLVARFALAVSMLPLATWFLARALGSELAARRAAALSVLLPAPLLYFPDVDVLHPLLYALAAGAWLRRARGATWALLAGGVAALLVAFSFGNLALYAAFAALALLSARAGGPGLRSEWRHAATALAPLASLVAGAELSGARPLAMFAQALRQHHAILAHRTPLLWVALHPLELAVGLGFPLVLAFGSSLDWRALLDGVRRRALAGGPLLLAATLLVLLVVDLSGQGKGEAARLWMGWTPLLLAGGCGALETRSRGWGRLAVGLAATLVVLKGFYVFVWLYRLS